MACGFLCLFNFLTHPTPLVIQPVGFFFARKQKALLLASKRANYGYDVG